MNREEMETWLSEVPVLVEPQSGEDQMNLLDLMNQPGFKVLVGLLFGARQGAYAQLSQSPLGTAAQSCAASVIQGRISGIEMIFETVLEHSTPSGADE